MNLFALILAAGTFWLSTAASPVHSQMVVDPTCRTDADAPGFVQQMQVLVLRVTPEQLSRYGFVPTDTSTVALVTDEATCAQAVAVYNTYRQANPPPDGAIVAASLYASCPRSSGRTVYGGPSWPQDYAGNAGLPAIVVDGANAYLIPGVTDPNPMLRSDYPRKGPGSSVCDVLAPPL